MFRRPALIACLTLVAQGTASYELYLSASHWASRHTLPWLEEAWARCVAAAGGLVYGGVEYGGWRKASGEPVPDAWWARDDAPRPDSGPYVITTLPGGQRFVWEWVAECTYVQVAAGVFPLLIRQPQIRAVFLAAAEACLLAFAVNWARLGLMLVLLLSGVDRSTAHDFPFWGGQVAAYVLASRVALGVFLSSWLSAMPPTPSLLAAREQFVRLAFALAALLAAGRMNFSGPAEWAVGETLARTFHTLLPSADSKATYVPPFRGRCLNCTDKPHGIWVPPVTVLSDPHHARQEQSDVILRWRWYARHPVRIPLAPATSPGHVILPWTKEQLHLDVALALWPLLITRWRPWPILRAAVFAAGLAFALNLLRLYAMAALLWYAGLPFGWARDLPNWTATATAFALGLWYMWRTARKQIEQRPAPDAAATARPPAPGHHASG